MNRKLFIRILLFSILGSIVLFNILYAERITINEGKGWDGIEYAKLCKNFNEDFKNNKISTYLFKKSLPLALIHNVVERVDLPRTVKTYSFLMLIISGIFILLSAIIFFFISDYHKFNPTVEIIIYSSLFFNYPILKLMGYYPLLLDYLAFSFGIISYYFYIKKHTIALISISVVFAFVWPTALLQGLLLAFLQRTNLLPTSDKKIENKKDLAYKLFQTLIFGFPIIIYLLYGGATTFLHKFQRSVYRNVTNDDLMIISFTSTLFFMYLFIKRTLFRIDVKEFFKDKAILRYLGIGLIYGLVSLFIRLNSNGQNRPIISLIYEQTGESLQAPFTNIVNLFAYYGFAIILVLIYWKEVSNFILSKGVGYLLVICMSFIFAIGNESRYFINYLPFIFFPVFIILKDKLFAHIKLYHAIFYVVLSLGLSRVWFSINQNGAFVWDRYMLSQGPWQPFRYYCLFLGLFLLSYLLIYLFIKRIRIIKNEK